MNYPSNVTFTTKQFSPTITQSNNEDCLMLVSPVFVIRQFRMTIEDVVEQGSSAIFTINAELVSKNQPDILQRLKLITNTPKTYIMGLNFQEKEGDNVYSLVGRNTSKTRGMARKLLLDKLALSDYNESIEKTRQDTLYAYSNYITTTLFEPNIVRTQQNLPVVNTWLTKLLG